MPSVLLSHTASSQQLHHPSQLAASEELHRLPLDLALALALGQLRRCCRCESANARQMFSRSITRQQAHAQTAVCVWIYIGNQPKDLGLDETGLLGKRAPRSRARQKPRAWKKLAAGMRAADA